MYNKQLLKSDLLAPTEYLSVKYAPVAEAATGMSVALSSSQLPLEDIEEYFGRAYVCSCAARVKFAVKKAIKLLEQPGSFNINR
jgi:hypothetical protein